MSWVDPDPGSPYPYISAGTWYTRYYYLKRHIQVNGGFTTVHDLRVAEILRHASRRSKIREHESGREALAELERIINGTYPYHKGKRSSSETGLG